MKADNTDATTATVVVNLEFAPGDIGSPEVYRISVKVVLHPRS